MPPGPHSTFLTASIAFNETIYTGVPSDTWPSVWAANGQSYGMGGDMPGSGLFKCVGPNGKKQQSYTNSFSYTKTAEGGVSMTLLNCTAGTSSVQEVYDVCNGGKAGSVFVAPNLKPVSMLTVDDQADRIFAFVQCTFEGPCVHDSDDPLACDDKTYPACQRGINTWLVSSRDGYTWEKESAYDMWTGRLTAPMFIPAGKAYSSAPDEYAYVHFPVSANSDGNGTERSCWYGNDYLLLARVKRTRSAVTNRSAYEWWAGESKWVVDDSQAAKHFEYHHMIGAPHTFYNAALKRYILPNYGSVNAHTKLPWSETAGVGQTAKSAFPSKYANCFGASCPYHSTQLTLYEAENPWGPWNQFYFQSQFEWGGEGPQGAAHAGAVDDTYSSGAYSPDFPAEWISEDGKLMMMVSTACCNFTSHNSTGLVPREAGYQAHWTPVRIALKTDNRDGSDYAADGYVGLLRRLRFLNSGVVRSTQRFELHAVRTIYNEQYSYLGTGTEGDVTSGTQAYLYEVNGSSPAPPASFKKNFYPVNATLCSHCDRGGGDIPGPTPTAPSYDACARLCGANPACLSWVWNQATTKCYPKSAVLTPSASASPDFSGCSPSYPPEQCKTAPGPPGPVPVPSYMGKTPPTGMRSAVPIGCLGMGTVELRADGALRDWRLVFNNGPEAPDGWNHKLTLEMEDAMFGLAFSQPANDVSQPSDNTAIPLRTQLPPGLSNLPQRPVDQLSYEGAFPAARLNVTDTRLPQGLAVSMVARGQFAVGSPEESAAPAAIFDVIFDNTAGQVDATPSAFFALPNVIGATSFEASGSGERVLVLGQGQHPIHQDGGMAIGVEGADSWAWSSAGTNSSDGVATLFESFAAGGMKNTSQVNASAGAVEATIRVPKGQIRVVTIVMTWYFPHHIWAGEFATDLGNFYSNLWESAEHVALSVAANKTRSLQHALGFHASFLDTDLPPYLKDALINSAAVFTKTSMFMKDGQFRMWESHSCQDLQPPHIHFYRAQALQTLFPSLERQIPVFYNHSQVKVDNETFQGSAQARNSNGEMSWYTPHRHGNCSCGACDANGGCPGDEACFQCMAGAIFNGHGSPGKCTAPGCISFTDETQANRVDNVFNFIMDTYMNSKWHADGVEFAASLYPGIKLAFSWLLRSSAKWGLPEGRLNTNDEHGIMGTLGSYNSIVYLSALAAVEDLAESLNDTSTAAAAKTAQTRGVQALTKLLARDDRLASGRSYFASFWCADGPENVTGSHALQSSVMYGYNWAMVPTLYNTVRAYIWRGYNYTYFT